MHVLSKHRTRWAVLFRGGRANSRVQKHVGVFDNSPPPSHWQGTHWLRATGYRCVCACYLSGEPDSFLSDSWAFCIIKQLRVNGWGAHSVSRADATELQSHPALERGHEILRWPPGARGWLTADRCPYMTPWSPTWCPKTEAVHTAGYTPPAVCRWGERRVWASRRTTWEIKTICLPIQSFAKRLQRLRGRRDVSCWDSSNNWSVVFMRLSMWGHAMKRTRCVMKESLSTGDDALSPSLHTSKGNPPFLDLLYLCICHEAFELLNMCAPGTEPSLFGSEGLTPTADVLK